MSFRLDAKDHNNHVSNEHDLSGVFENLLMAKFVFNESVFDKSWAVLGGLPDVYYKDTRVKYTLRDHYVVCNYEGDKWIVVINPVENVIKFPSMPNRDIAVYSTGIIDEAPEWLEFKKAHPNAVLHSRPEPSRIL